MKKIVILGGGESGTGAAVLAKKKGYDVFVSDKGEIKTKYKDVLLHNDIEWEENRHSEKLILTADEVVKSPGIADNIEIIRTIKRKKINIISEIEFAARFTKAKLIGITGTNGKTTTSSLIYHIFSQAGLDVCLAGNVGNSFALALAERDYQYFILELSSFQLDYMFETKINDAVLLNITPDHLDRYNYKIRHYINSKFRIINNHTSNEGLIYCADDDILKKEFKRRKIDSEIIPYSIEKHINKGAYLEKNIINMNYNTTFNMNIEELAIKGKHNIYNSMAAALIAKRHEIRNEKVKECFGNYVNIEHRLESVAKIRSVEYINDSKATNVNATWYALESCNGQVIWIAGGVDKGNDYGKIKELVRDKVKYIVCLGIDNSNIISAFKNDVDNIFETKTMDDAVALSYKLSNPGDIVLLSPACASFDLFNNYEDRGNQFKEIVKNL